MKLITDTIYGHQRAYIGAVAVVWIPQWDRPTVGWCADIVPEDELNAGTPRWSYHDDNGIMDNRMFAFQPDQSKIQPGEWCWPVTTPPVTPERIKEVRRMCAVSYERARDALETGRGEIDVAVRLLGGEKRYMGKCNRVTCIKDATCRDDYTLSCWCDDHVPEGREVWRTEPAIKMPETPGPAHDALRRVMASAGVSESAARMALEHTNGDVDAAVAGLAHYQTGDTTGKRTHGPDCDCWSCVSYR